MSSEVEIVRPGIHRDARLERFRREELKIVYILSRQWFVTAAGVHNTPTSKYRFALLKPTLRLQEMFGVEREILAIFSHYKIFDTRTFDAIGQIQKKYPDKRIDKICSIIFSEDPAIEKKVLDIAKTDSESAITIPFSYAEMGANDKDENHLNNKLRRVFYARDLFSFNSPLKKDLYFFGRSNLIHEIVSRHESFENTGLFGLRKTGKTSVIFGVERALNIKGVASVIIDCQSTAVHNRRWNQVLHYIINQIVTKYDSTITIKNEDKYSLTNAAIAFEDQLVRINSKLGKRIVIVFDEIENLSPATSPSDHWRSGDDFVLFWQSIRSVFQKRSDLFTYLIVGTNPMCVETPTINGKDNPIFSAVPFQYIPPFSPAQVREMVSRLGGFMGLTFDESIYTRLCEDYGGHPFLIRHMCSTINRTAPQTRPVIVDRLLYNEAKKKFEDGNSTYVEMIIQVLRDFYPNEYEMLKFLASEDYESFNTFLSDSRSYINHLVGYGIIRQSGQVYDFNIDIIKRFLLEQGAKKDIRRMKQEEMWTEISEARNPFETKMRRLVRSLLVAAYGESEAKEKFLDLLGPIKTAKYKDLSFKEIMSGGRADVYFEDLRKAINKNWSVFEKVFEKRQDLFDRHMIIVNSYRKDAHAGKITSDEMGAFRVSMKWLAEHVDPIVD